MLQELSVRNLLLIEQAQLQFHPAFNVISGETGAGKSLLLGALQFLLGEKPRASVVRKGASEAEVSGRFVLKDLAIVEALEQCGIGFPDDGEDAEVGQELVLTRILPVDGRSRAYANGRPISVQGLREASEVLVDLHGQHENQSLLRPAARLEILDRFAGALEEKKAMRQAWQRVREAAQACAEWRAWVRDRRNQEDLLRFQLDELERARLDQLAPDELDEELRRLRHADKIQEQVLRASELLDGAGDASATVLLGQALRALSGLERLGRAEAALVSRAEGLQLEARELARDLDALGEQARGNPQRLNQLEETQAMLRQLERKYSRGHAGLLQLLQDLRNKAQAMDNAEEKGRELEAALQAALEDARARAGKLSQKRHKAAKRLERETAAELRDLGLPKARLSAELKPVQTTREGGEVEELLPRDLNPHGFETFDLLFSANPSLEPQPLAQCASGGELSRVMLALKTVLAKEGGADRLPVVVFDEIDTGVGGRLGSVLGAKLAALSQVRQVLCITHLPQVAAYAAAQFKVDKSGASKGKGAEPDVEVTPLQGRARIEEIAQMLRGKEVTARTLAEAEEMLGAARS